MDRIRSSKIGYAVLAWVVVLAILVQVSLIGLWFFAGQSTLYLHKEFGHLITLMIGGLLILAYVGRLPRRLRLTTALLTAISVVQTEVFALIPGSALRAFHTVLPLVIFSLAAFLAYGAIPVVRDRPKRLEFPRATAESRAG